MLFGIELNAKKIKRRDFIFGTVIGGSSLALWRFIPISHSHKIKSLVLSSSHINTLIHIYQSITLDVTSSEEAGLFMNDFIEKNVFDQNLLELKIGLILFEQTPLFLIGRWSRFSELSKDEQKNLLSKMAQNKLLYPLFRGMKELSYMAYYKNDKNWEKIGYQGPLISSPHDYPELSLDYLKLLAPK